jgi:hypothetical protein
MLFSYVVRWDHGFAPNPFYGTCTIATCKPYIRKKAIVGDWILGTGSAEREFQGRAIFLMRVTDATRFDDYWKLPDFTLKKPVMNGSLKQRFGDNIYHRDTNGNWVQADSRHSRDDLANEDNLRRDTKTTDRVLISSDFVYWGEDAPNIPKSFHHFVIARQGWEEITDQVDITAFVDWAKSFGLRGQVGVPLEWRYERWWR